MPHPLFIDVDETVVFHPKGRYHHTYIRSYIGSSPSNMVVSVSSAGSFSQSYCYVLAVGHSYGWHATDTDVLYFFLRHSWVTRGGDPSSWVIMGVPSASKVYPWARRGVGVVRCMMCCLFRVLSECLFHSLLMT